MSNDFSRRNAETLTAIAAAAASKMGGTTNPFGTSQALVTSMTTGASALSASINAQIAAQSAEKAATEQKAVKRAALVDALNAVADVVYANPAVTDEMLLSIGFAPRRGAARRPATPAKPTGLTATPTGDGDVRLAWNRNGARRGVVFVVESSADGATWSYVKSTACTRFVATGYAPGAPTWFRVSATTSTASSGPCACAVIYAPPVPVESVQLRVA